jgi:threonine dehydrogenase-like Zn-dependent dehydrogenase
LVSGGHIDVASLITHNFSLAQTGDAFDLVADTRDNVIKASIDQ